MRAYILVGHDKEGQIDCAGAFSSKVDAHNFVAQHQLNKKIPGLVILPVTIKGASNETTEGTGYLQPQGKSVAKGI
jgi:hypothetical protein